MPRLNVPQLSIFVLISILSSITFDAMASFATISVDGDASDWSGIAAIATDPSGDANGNGIDFTDLYAANDNDYLYIRYDLASSVDPYEFFTHVMVNTDGDVNTGIGSAVHGSDIALEYSTLYQTTSNFVDGGLIDTSSGLLMGPLPGVGGTVYEVAIPLTLLFLHDGKSGVAAFSSDTVGITVENGGLDLTSEFIGNVSYTLVPEPASLLLVGLGVVSMLTRRPRYS